jgi:hypothetical protein
MFSLVAQTGIDPVLAIFLYVIAFALAVWICVLIISAGVRRGMAAARRDAAAPAPEPPPASGPKEWRERQKLRSED